MKVILFLVVVLVMIFFIFFLIGKWNFILVKGVVNESIRLVNM